MVTVEFAQYAGGALSVDAFEGRLAGCGGVGRTERRRRGFGLHASPDAEGEDRPRDPAVGHAEKQDVVDHCGACASGRGRLQSGADSRRVAGARLDEQLAEGAFDVVQCHAAGLYRGPSMRKGDSSAAKASSAWLIAPSKAGPNVSAKARASARAKVAGSTVRPVTPATLEVPGWSG